MVSHFNADDDRTKEEVALNDVFDKEVYYNYESWGWKFSLDCQNVQIFRIEKVGWGIIFYQKSITYGLRTSNFSMVNMTFSQALTDTLSPRDRYRCEIPAPATFNPHPAPDRQEIQTVFFKSKKRLSTWKVW